LSKKFWRRPIAAEHHSVAGAVATMMRSLFLVGVAAGSVVEQWNEFQEKYGRQYASDAERLQRFQAFADNVDMMRKMAAMDPTATYTHLSPLADVPQRAFLQRQALKVSRADIAAHARDAAAQAGLIAAAPVPKSFDWRERGAVNGVKDQGQCGSCWAFSTVANVEAQNFLQNGQLLSLSEQELVSCDKTDEGCDGGLPTNAMKQLIARHEGLELESDYPYAAEAGHCAAEKSKELVFLRDVVKIGANEVHMQRALVEYGTLSVAMNAGHLQMYSSGISDPWFCNPLALDHAVALVGFGEQQNRWLPGSTKFWTVRNSWGEGWGEKGYFRLVRGKGKCGINTMASSAVVAKKNESVTFV